MESTFFSRRQFLAQASCFGAFYAFASKVQLPALAGALLDDPRISQTPLVDAGYASVRKIGEGLYATISDTTKGFTTICNGGFLIGKESALLIEGFGTTVGAAFQMDAYRKVSQVPIQAALDTHYHFDHSMGNAYYGANGVQLWGHAAVTNRIVQSYVSLQGADRAAFLAPYEKRVNEAKSEAQKAHAEGDLRALTTIFDMANHTSLALPNHPLDPAKLPLTLDLGHFPVVLESYPGHSGTDIIVCVPEQKVVYSGDLIFNGAYPACFDEKATVSGWRATLKTFASWDKDTLYVPGHGQVCGQDGIQRLRDVFDDIAEQAEKMYKSGIPASEASERYVIPEKFKNLGIFAWGLTIAPTITKLYGEWRGK
jgi:cyclase